jgi:fibronectin type 3 domain-containing protein
MEIVFVARPLQRVRKMALGMLCSLLLISAVAASHSDNLKPSDPQTAPRPHSVDLKWKAGVSGVVGYNVYRSEMDRGPYTKLTSAPIRATNYTDRSVESGHTYFYAVTAVDSRGKESVHSNQAKALIPSP